MSKLKQTIIHDNAFNLVSLTFESFDFHDLNLLCAASALSLFTDIDLNHAVLTAHIELGKRCHPSHALLRRYSRLRSSAWSRQATALTSWSIRRRHEINVS